MRTINIRLLGLTAATLALAVNIGAQDTKGVLNVVELQRLATRGSVEDNAKLADHFNALAARETAEADNHAAMAQSFGGNPNHGVNTTMAVHCKQLGDLNRQSAGTLRELAVYHEKLAIGLPATPPRDAAPYERGKGAKDPTQKELTAMAAKARTPSERGALAEYFQTLVQRYTKEASDYAAMANAFRGTKMASTVADYDRLAALARDSAREAADSVEMHRSAK
jgi:hypothetical protein